ncbi:hypothetical protein HJC99_05815 [Candidatus Saccharibacteria bacterium]|nr:hypothetical protein [Candidatus Saccharibacteria bacterium]
MQTAMLAALGRIVRAVCYTDIFYVKSLDNIGSVDWVLAGAHVVTALLLVATVLLATVVLFSKHPIANTQFVPYFLPGLAVVLLLCAVPQARLYRSRI